MANGPEIHCPISGQVIRESILLSGQESRYLTEYEEIELIGSGGFGVVVKCQNKLDKVIYAIKKKICLRKIFLPFDTVKREVLVLSSLDHPCIVRYFQAWVEETLAGMDYESSDEEHTDEQLSSPCLYIQMAYCPSSLEMLLELNQLDDGKASKLFKQIVEGISYIHSKGIVHCDLSCKNILLNEHEDIKIADFGLSKFIDVENEPVGSDALGAALYRAPEVKKGKIDFDFKVDVYSLGIILFELFTHFGTKSERYNILKKLKETKEVPSDFKQEKLLLALLSESPLDRPSTADILQEKYKYWETYEGGNVECSDEE